MDPETTATNTVTNLTTITNTIVTTDQSGLSNHRVSSRKFILASFFSLISAISLFVGKIDGTMWLEAMGLILGLYGASSVSDKKLNPTQQP